METDIMFKKKKKNVYRNMMNCERFSLLIMWIDFKGF